MSTNRNRMIGGFEDAFEKGQAAVKSSATSSAKDFTNTVKAQVVGDTSQKPPQEQGTNESGSAAQNSQQSQMTDEERVEFLSNLYGKSNDGKPTLSGQNNSQKGTGDVRQALGIPQKDLNAGKTPEEIAKMESLRKQLHSDYYQDLLNKSKSKEEPVAEKLEREEQEEQMAELEDTKKKPSELPKTVRQGTGESVVGMSG